LENTKPPTNEGRESEVQAALLGVLLKEGSVRLGAAVRDLAKSEGLPSYVVARSICKMAADGSVRLEPAPSPGGIGGFFSLSNGKYLLLLLLPFVTGVSILESQASLAIQYLRIVSGSFVVLVLPGYGLIKVLYPSKELSTLEVWVYSGITSLALIPFLSLALNYSRWGITLDSTSGSFMVVDVILLLAASIRSLAAKATTGPS